MKRVGVSELRKMNANYLKALDKPLEICHHNKPLQILFPYAQYVKLQQLLLAALGVKP